jgi:hypothetical protein
MKDGLLWYDDSSHRTLPEKVARAAAAYMKKHRQVPGICFVHPSALSNGPIKVGVVEVRPLPTVLRHHFWIGEEEEQ